MHGPVRNGVLADIVLVDPHVRAGCSARAFMCSGVDTWVRVAYGQSLHFSLSPRPNTTSLPHEPRLAQPTDPPDPPGELIQSSGNYF